MAQIEAKDRKAPGDESLETQRRRQLMLAAAECVAEMGVDRTTMRMIADRAGVTTGMLLYYFRSKKELIAATIAAADEAFSAHMDALTDGTFGPKRIRAILEGYLSDPQGVPRNFNLQYRLASLSDQDLRRGYVAQYDLDREKLARSIRSGKQLGELREDIDDFLATDFILVLLQGLAAEEALNPEIISRERALSIGLLALSFLARGPSNGSEGVTPSAVEMPPPAPTAPSRAKSARPARGRTAEAIEAALMADPALEPATAKELARSFRTLYEIARRP
jgi:AcrR family transcriptional regulator